MPARPEDRRRDTFRTYYRDGLERTFTDAKGLTLRRYDLNGNLKFLSDASVSSPRGPTTLHLDFNGFDEIASSTALEENRDRKVTTYAYWRDGLLKARADDQEEDGSGAVVRAARQHTFAYDEDRRLIEHLDLGREEGPEDDKRITRAYFANDLERELVIAHRVGETFAPRHTTRYEYFDNGLMRSLRTWGGAAEDPLLRESHTLDYFGPGPVYLNGNPTRDTFFRDSPEPGTRCGAPDDTCTMEWTYDGGDRLIIEDNGRGERTRYKLNSAGGIKEKRDADDENDVEFRAEFDGPRMAKRTLLPNSLDPLTEVFHYDVDGNLECITTEGGTPEADCTSTDPASPKLREDFTYDYRNRLTAWNKPAESRSTTYEHDALDRPTLEVEVVGNSTTRHELSYVGATRLLAREDETGARQKTRLYSHDAYGRLIGLSYRSDGGPTHELTYAHDAKGSVSMLLDEGGEPKAVYGYEAYGDPDEALTVEHLPGTEDEPDPTEQVNPFRYSGKRTGALSGTIDMGARQFGPSLGQFLQADRFDSAVDDLGLGADALTGNRYALAGGNPISFVEVDGHGTTTGGQDSRVVMAPNSAPYDREKGKFIAGPNKGSGPGGSGFVAPAPSAGSGGGSGLLGSIGNAGQKLAGKAGSIRSNAAPLVARDQEAGRSIDPFGQWMIGPGVDLAGGAYLAFLDREVRKLERVVQVRRRQLQAVSPILTREPRTRMDRYRRHYQRQAVERHGQAADAVDRVKPWKVPAEVFGPVWDLKERSDQLRDGMHPIEVGLRQVGESVGSVAGGGAGLAWCGPGCVLPGEITGGLFGERMGALTYDHGVDLGESFKDFVTMPLKLK
jgi:RHS repeat-associated protein